jgi:predicted metal-binding transcription factor (methanogenesis marker protein 9)
MKIMKAVDKKVGETTYYKYKINLPKKIVEDSKLSDKEVKVTLDKKKIIIEEE